MAKIKGLKNLKGSDINKYLLVLYDTDKSFDDVWKAFCDEYVLSSEKELTPSGEYANPILKELKDKFLEFYNGREKIKKEIDAHILEINDLFTKNK